MVYDKAIAETVNFADRAIAAGRGLLIVRVMVTTEYWLWARMGKNSRVLDIKAIVYEKVGVPPLMQKLSHDGYFLPHYGRLQNARGLIEDTTVYLHIGPWAPPKGDNEGGAGEQASGGHDIVQVD